jgi:hypothetical protein
MASEAFFLSLEMLDDAKLLFLELAIQSHEGF